MVVSLKHTSFEKERQIEHVGQTGIINQGVKDFFSIPNLRDCFFVCHTKNVHTHNSSNGSKKPNEKNPLKKCYNFILNLVYDRKEVKDKISVKII